MSGKLKVDVGIATTSLESEMKSLQGEEKTSFPKFSRRMLRWRPEDRATARELVQDPWIQGILASSNEEKIASLLYEAIQAD